MCRNAVIIPTLFCLGMTASSAALGGHLTLPGSQNLHQSQDSVHQSLTRQLEAINQYTSPQALSNRENEALPKHHVLPTIEPSPAQSPVPRSGMARKLPAAPPALSHSPSTDHSVFSLIPVHPNTAQDHTEMGWMFLLNGRLQAAMAAYREAIRHQPHYAKAHIGMGITLKSLGKSGPAKQAIQHALKLKPNLSSALVHLGYLYADGQIGHRDFESARRLFDRAFRLGDPFAGIALVDLRSRSRT